MKIEYIYIAVAAWFVIILSYGWMRTMVQITIDNFGRRQPTMEITRVVETTLKPIVLRNIFKTDVMLEERAGKKQAEEFNEHNFRAAFRQMAEQIYVGKLYEARDIYSPNPYEKTTEITIHLLKKDNGR